MRFLVANADEGGLVLTLDDEGVKIEPQCKGLQEVRLAGYGAERSFSVGQYHHNISVVINDTSISSSSCCLLRGDDKVELYCEGLPYLVGRLTSVLEGSEGT